MAQTTEVRTTTGGTSVIVRMAQRFGVDADKMVQTLRATCFKGEVSNEQLMALCIVAEEYKLNPWTREIFAFADKRTGAIVPVVSVDGWARIINGHPQFDGMEFEDGPGNPPEWIECVIHRKDRSHPTKVRERMSECKRGTDPWASHPARMLRHKSLIQCARIAFGFAGIYDEDEAERIVAGETLHKGPLPTANPAPVKSATERLKERVRSAVKIDENGEVIVVANQPEEEPKDGASA